MNYDNTRRCNGGPNHDCKHKVSLTGKGKCAAGHRVLDGVMSSSTLTVNTFTPPKATLSIAELFAITRKYSSTEQIFPTQRDGIFKMFNQDVVYVADANALNNKELSMLELLKQVTTSFFTDENDRAYIFTGQEGELLLKSVLTLSVDSKEDAQEARKRYYGLLVKKKEWVKEGIERFANVPKQPLYVQQMQEDLQVLQKTLSELNKIIK